MTSSPDPRDIACAREALTEYPDPTPEMLDSPEFDAVWQAIKGWDLKREGACGYAGATGNDVRHILDALAALKRGKEMPR